MDVSSAVEDQEQQEQEEGTRVCGVYVYSLVPSHKASFQNVMAALFI